MPDPSQVEGTPLRLIWPIRPDVTAHYCNQFAVTATGAEFVIDFGQVLLGAGGRTLKEITDEIGATHEVTVKARIVMSPAAVLALEELLVRTVRKLKEDLARADNAK